MTEPTIETLINQYADRLHDLPELREREGVFHDRQHAGRTLAEMLSDADPENPLVLAVPAGGVPVAVVMADQLGWPLDVAVVSKITLPHNTEVGCGAIAFDGTLDLNEPLIDRAGLGEVALQRRITETRRKVQRRFDELRPARGPMDLTGKNIVLVDDGLASGFTMMVAVRAARSFNPAGVAVAVPTSPARSASLLLEYADELWCPNLRSSPRFAVAAAYCNWRDVSEDEALATLQAGRS
ncbi:MAG: phosphoribosyltransferase [Planctomycetota bacterium]